MKCPGDDSIARYVDGELNDAAASELRAHMDSCEACRSLVAEVAQDVVPPTRIADPLDVGTVLVGKYRILEIIGVGGMGVVVSALHEELGQKVAIKVVHGESLQDRDTVKRFLREGRAAARLRSDHAVRIYDVGRLPGGAPFLVMEHLEGQDLAALARERLLDFDEAVDYLLQAIEAISEAHSLGLVHRDIKPANLFLATLQNGDTRVKVLDFGLAKDLQGLGSSAESNLTTEHMFIGSPMFMSPEQIRDPRAVDKRTDIWSLGATLWQLVTGQPPFATGSVQSTLAEVCTRNLPPASHVRKGIPRRIDDAIARAMQKDREQRFATVEELAIALGGPLRRSSSRHERAPETPKAPATALMPDVNLESPTVVDEKRLPVFRVTAPMPATPAGIPSPQAMPVAQPPAPLPAPVPSPRSAPTVGRAKPPPSTSARTIVLLALVPVVALAVFAATKLRPKVAASHDPPSTASGIIVVVPVTAAPTTSAPASSASASSSSTASVAPVESAAPSASVAATPPTRKPTAPSGAAKKPASTPSAKPTGSPYERDPYDR